MELKNFFVQDLAGNAIPGAIGRLYDEGTTTLAGGLEDSDGNPQGNPMQANAIGQLQFAAPDGRYDLYISSAARNYTIRVEFFDASNNSLKNDLSQSSGAGLVGFVDAGTGAVPTTVQEAIRRQWVNVMSYGAAGVGGDDTLAVQRAMAYALVSGKALYFPAGNYGITSQLTAANKSLTIVGDGTGVSKLWVDHAAKGIAYSSTDRTQNLTIRGIEVISSNASAVTGIDVTFPTTSAVDQSQLSITDTVVRVSGAGTWNYACIRLDGVKNPFLERVIVRGAIATTLYGISLEGQTIDGDISTTRAYLVGTGISIIGANEGTTIRGYTAVTVKRGIDVNPTNSGPWVSVSNFHINCSEIGIRCNKRTQVEINNGLLYANNLLGSATWTGISIEHDAGSFAEYCNVDSVIFNRQSYANPTVGVNHVNARFCKVSNCDFVNVASPFVEDAATNSILRWNNEYPGVTNPVTKAAASGGEPLRIDHTAFAQNRFAVAGALTGSGPSITAEGIDAIIGAGIYAKGAGATITLGAIGAGTGLQVTVPASSVNRVRVQSAIAGQPAKVDVTGTDAQIWLSLQGKGSVGGLMFPIAADYANDAAAAAGGVPLRGVYHTAGALKIRLV